MIHGRPTANHSWKKRPLLAGVAMLSPLSQILTGTLPYVGIDWRVGTCNLTGPVDSLVRTLDGLQVAGHAVYAPKLKLTGLGERSIWLNPRVVDRSSSGPS
jgi:hypothetical protein